MRKGLSLTYNRHSYNIFIHKEPMFTKFWLLFIITIFHESAISVYIKYCFKDRIVLCTHYFHSSITPICSFKFLPLSKQFLYDKSFVEIYCYLNYLQVRTFGGIFYPLHCFCFVLHEVSIYKILSCIFLVGLKVLVLFSSCEMFLCPLTFLTLHTNASISVYIVVYLPSVFMLFLLYQMWICLLSGFLSKSPGP